MSEQRTALGRTTIASIIVVAVIVAGTLAYFLFASPFTHPPSPSSITATASTVCSISGQPGPFFLRILSDSTLTPLDGAHVTATNRPAYCGGAPATNQTAVAFTTNNTEWYSLDANNNAGYSFVVRWTPPTGSGGNYSFTADLRPVSVTCATLFIPSGRTNIIITEFQTTCKQNPRAPDS